MSSSIRICYLLMALLALSFTLTHAHPSKTANDGNLDDYYNDETEDEDDPEEEESEEVAKMLSQSQDFTVRSGESLMLPCQTSSTNAVVQWRFKERPMYLGMLDQAGDDNVVRQSNNSLLIKNVNLDYAGDWSCQILQTAPNDIKIYFNVSVYHKPRITKMSFNGVEDSSLTAKAGSHLKIICQSVGFEQPKITFEYPNKKMESSNIVVSDNSLDIDALTKHDTGLYHCTATNTMGTDTLTRNLTVEYPPEISVKRDTVSTAINRKAEIVCTIDAHPTPEVRWMKGQKPLSVGNQHVKQILPKENGNDYKLEFSSVKDTDLNSYTCTAKNRLDSASKTVILTALPSVPAVENVENKEDGLAEITWSLVSHAPILEYVIEYKIQEDDEWQSISLEKPEPGTADEYKVIYKFEGLTSGIYQARIKARNQYGWSNTSSLQTFSGLTKKEKSTQQNQGVHGLSDNISNSNEDKEVIVKNRQNVNKPQEHRDQAVQQNVGDNALVESKAQGSTPGNGGEQLRIPIWTFALVLISTLLCH